MRSHILAIIAIASCIAVSVSAAEGNWKNPSSWDKVRDGMSESQVISILGEPTTTKDLGSMRTLFYRGKVEDSGFVSGNVKLDEDRVWDINKPVF